MATEDVLGVRLREGDARVFTPPSLEALAINIDSHCNTSTAATSVISLIASPWQRCV